MANELASGGALKESATRPLILEQECPALDSLGGAPPSAQLESLSGVSGRTPPKGIGMSDGSSGVAVGSSPRCRRGPSKVAADEGAVDRRVIRLLPDVATGAIVPTDRHDLESRAREVNRSHAVPVALPRGRAHAFRLDGLSVALSSQGSPARLLRRRCAAQALAMTAGEPLELRFTPSGAHSPDDPRVDEDPERLRALQKTLGEDYRRVLREKAELDRRYHQLFLRALAHAGVAPLTMRDDSKGGPDLPVFDYVPDVQADRGDPSWVARSCTWQVEATLYEVTNPRSFADPDRGRRLVLRPSPGYRTDLAAVPAQDLEYPDGMGVEDYDQPWVARAAEVSYLY
jgi:hypothetical protein